MTKQITKLASVLFLMQASILSTSGICEKESSGGMPFSVSGQKIAVIFKNEILWRQLGGAVESILFKGHANGISTYAVTTTEFIGNVDANGVTTGYTPTPCLVLVNVGSAGDEMLEVWEVKSVDFSACPKHMGSK